jgi:hypothetical protein
MAVILKVFFSETLSLLYSILKQMPSKQSCEILNESSPAFFSMNQTFLPRNKFLCIFQIKRYFQLPVGDKIPGKLANPRKNI